MAVGSWVKYKTKGFKELSKALDGLTEPKFRSQALRVAGRKAMQPTLSKLKAAAPVVKQPSKLPKTARVGQLRDGLRLTVRAPVQPRISKRGTVTKATKRELSASIYTGTESSSFAIVSEYGRKEHTVVRYSAFGRPVLAFEQKLPMLEPRPWMRTTFDSDKANIVDRFRQELGKSIERKIRQQARIFKSRGERDVNVG